MYVSKLVDARIGFGCRQGGAVRIQRTNNLGLVMRGLNQTGAVKLGEEPARSSEARSCLLRSVGTGVSRCKLLRNEKERAPGRRRSAWWRISRG